MQLGPAGTRLIESYEQCTLFVYDDFHEPPREWMGGEVDGTLTIGWGHTDDAAGKLPTPTGKIERGLRITQAQADALFQADMAECVADVNRSVDVDRTQGQQDALISFRFNCGLGNLRKLVAPLNAGNPDGTYAKFPLYNKSKGKPMTGLVRRRAAEQALWKNKTDILPMSPPPHGGTTPDAPSHTVPPSHVNPTAVAAGAGAVVTAGQQVKDQLDQLNTTLTSVTGIETALASLLTNPKILVAMILCGLVFALWYAHRQHTEA